jgi:hypothetical protein
MHWACIQEAPCLSLGHGGKRKERKKLRFINNLLQSLLANVRVVPQLGHNHFLPNPFQNNYHLVIRCYIVWDDDNIMNN